MSSNAERVTVVLSADQLTFVRGWGLERSLTSDTDILRAILREQFGDALPADPPARGGKRYQPPLPGQTVVLKETFGHYRAGVSGVFERRTTHGGMVAFANAVVLVPYRLLRSETDGEGT